MHASAATPAPHKVTGFVCMVAAIAALTGLLFGYDTGVISGAILFIQKKFALNAIQTGTVVSSVLLGALFGALISGKLADRYGRKRVLILTALIYIFASLATSMAGSIIELTLARVVLGVAIGMGSYTAPLYIAEVSPYQVRGILVSLNQLAITIGIVSSFFVDYHYADSGNWRVMFALGCLPGILLLVGMFKLPETPRWLALKGFKERARSVLQHIQGCKDVDDELSTILETTKLEESSKTKMAKWMRPALLVAVGLAIIQQITGINAVLYYAPTIFKMAGFHSNTTAILATVGVGLMNVFFTIIGLPLIDRLGRRPLLIVGTIGMAISLSTLGYVFSHPAYASELRWYAVTSLLVYIACFAASLGPIVWLVISEIFPLKVRGFGMSLATGANWLCNLIVALTFLSLLHKLGPGNTFFMFGFISIASCAFIFFLAPETKNCTLEQIEANLIDGLPTRELGIPSKGVKQQNSTA